MAALAEACSPADREPRHEFLEAITRRRPASSSGQLTARRHPAVAFEVGAVVGRVRVPAAADVNGVQILPLGRTPGRRQVVAECVTALGGDAERHHVAAQGRAADGGDPDDGLEAPCDHEGIPSLLVHGEAEVRRATRSVAERARGLALRCGNISAMPSF